MTNLWIRSPCIEHYISNIISILYQSGYFPWILLADAIIWLTKAYFDSIKVSENVVDYISDNGSFTVIDWYKQGLINKKTIVGGIKNKGNTRINIGDFNYHPYYIQSKNPIVLLQTTT